MTQHTTEYLRQRSSKMSLRMAAASNASDASQSLYDGFASRHTMNKAQTAFVVGDLSRRTSYKLCNNCQQDLSSTLRDAAEAQKCSIADSQDDCDTCSIASVKPEAFTEPFCAFLRENPTIFHSVEYFKSKAKAAGFEEVCLSHPIRLQIHGAGSNRNATSKAPA